MPGPLGPPLVPAALPPPTMGATPKGPEPPALVVGLGNPGPRYERTRHNIGFLVLDRLAGEDAFRRDRKWDADVARPPGEPVVFLKPQTFMNLSGRSVGAAARFLKIPIERILVVLDDVELPLGRLRFREKGSAGGHNGMRSIIQTLGTEAVPRLRIGVGRGSGDPRRDLADHVLGRFEPEEWPDVENCVDRAVSALRFALAHGIPAAMNEFNRKAASTGSPSSPSPHPPKANHDTANEEEV